MTPNDFMQRALDLSRLGLGRTAPNPSVGCVIVKEGKIIAQARSADGGRPHAEAQALAQAGNNARGADVYVTLEPCAHVGNTPSCASALVEAGVARVYVACIDPDPRTAGKGIARLREAGIDVVDGIGRHEAEEIHKGFLLTVTDKRPLIAMKVATSLDGRIAAADGTSQWITGEAARMRGHVLRSQYDAIVTGSGTFLADAPQLTVRLPEYDGPQPKRIILDRRGRVAAPDGWHVIRDEDYIAALYDMDLTRVLIEAGRGVSSAILKSGVVDELFWFRAPVVLGDAGLPVFDDLGIGTLHDKIGMERGGIETHGDDILEIYKRNV